jgi:hypothetical protein
MRKGTWNWGLELWGPAPLSWDASRHASYSCGLTVDAHSLQTLMLLLGCSSLTGQGLIQPLPQLPDLRALVVNLCGLLLDDAGVSLCQLGPDAWQQFISDEVGKLLRLRLFAAHEQPVDSRLREPRGHLLVVRLVLLSESLMLQVLGEASPTSTSFREHLRVMPSSLVLATRFLTAWAPFPALYCKVLHATSADINRLPFLSQYRVIASFMKPVRVAPCWNREMSKTASMS